MPQKKGTTPRTKNIMLAPLLLPRENVGLQVSVILVNYGRLMTGYESFGPGFTNDTDELGRGWEQDDFYSFSPKSILTTTQNILNTTLPPNYIPEKLYQACRSLVEGGSINYVFEVDSNLDYAIWLHFAEIDPKCQGTGATNV